MRKWFKACITLIGAGVIVLLMDISFGHQIDQLTGKFFGYHTISVFGQYPNASLAILLLTGGIFVLAYFSFLMGAKPVLDKELFGKKTGSP